MRVRSDVIWWLKDGGLVRTERLTSNRAIRVKRWRVVVPTTGSRWQTINENGERTDTFDGPDGRLAVTLRHADWPYTISGRATGNTADGRGARGQRAAASGIRDAGSHAAAGRGAQLDAALTRIG
jgi:hypothetical protein